MKRNHFLLCILAVVALSAAADQPRQAMFGHTPARNMATDATGLVADWDVSSGRNVKWSATVGSTSYAGPVILDGKVFVGTNNDGSRNEKLKGDRGVVMAFRESDGEFLWQMTHEKLPSGDMDWPQQGVCSTPTVVGDRLYYVSNRAEVVALDAEGFRDGENDGPFSGEKDTSPIDGDVVWSYDMIAALGIYPHNMAVGSPVVVGDLVFAPTSNAVGGQHDKMPAPDAPSFIALRRATGELVWQNAGPAGKVLHGAWSNPAYGTLDGRAQVIFPGGDGWLYALEPKTGNELWKFDCNPKDAEWKGGYGNRNHIISTPVIYDGKVYVGVGQDPENGDGPGNFWAIRPSGRGDLTAKAAVWNRGGDDFNRTLSTAAIADDVVYVPDLAGFLYALDAQSGAHLWTYDAFAAVWGSPLVADGKIYLGDEDGEVAVLKTGKTMKLLGELDVRSAVYSTPAAHDGVLFVLTRNRLYAFAPGRGPQPKASPDAAF